MIQQQVVVPWKLTSDRHRLDAFCWCLSKWVTAGYEVRVAQVNDDVWCKAATLARAVAESQPVFLICKGSKIVCCKNVQYGSPETVSTT